MTSESNDGESPEETIKVVKHRKPRPYVDLKKLERAMWLNPTLMQCALFFDTSQEHIEQLIDLNYGLTFAEFRSKNQMGLQTTLINRAIQMALEDKNTAMMIFSLKNICKWSDNEGGQAHNLIQLAYSLDTPPPPPVIPDDIIDVEVDKK